MTKALVAYTTNSGSTTEIAEAIADELNKAGAQVDVARLEQITNVEGYDLVIVGAPMILGWHAAARKFIKKHQAELSQRRVAYFAAAMSLTQTGETQIEATPIYIDTALAKPPKNVQRLSFRENYATPRSYLRPILRVAPQVRPVSMGFFGGKLELFRLKLLQMLFVMLAVQAQPGDMRNFNLIRKWASGLLTEID